VIFLNDFHAAFSSSLSWSSNLRPVLTRYLRSNKRRFFDFSFSYPENLIFQIDKYIATLIHCLDEIFYESKVDV